MAQNFEFEFLVQKFLVENGVTFLAPQFQLIYDKELDSGGSNPDFVAIRPSWSEIFVVEVSVSGNLNRLVEKTRDRERQWLRALRQTLTAKRIINDDWRIEVLAFIRQDQMAWFTSAIGQAADVHVWPIEFTLEPWRWPAEVRDATFDLRNTALCNRR